MDAVPRSRHCVSYRVLLALLPRLDADGLGHAVKREPSPRTTSDPMISQNADEYAHLAMKRRARRRRKSQTKSLLDPGT